MSFKHFNLSLFSPSFEDELTGLIIDLDHLRHKRLAGTTPQHLFFQLKDIFHLLESIGSARIEGNNTTIAEAIEERIFPSSEERTSNAFKEIHNIEEAMSFIEESIKGGYPLNSQLVRELQAITVKGLLPPSQGGEGDANAGQYRNSNVRIGGSSHTPPDWVQVERYMRELFDFIEQENIPRYDLIKIALAHHRFVWIHPFANGNGRTVRLFTYALLLKYGFDVDIAGRILNPTAIFCNDRDEYYHFLGLADAGTREGAMAWSEYMLRGLKREIEKVDRLCDFSYLKKHILTPALNTSLSRQIITAEERAILERAITEPFVIQNSDLQSIMPNLSASSRSNRIKTLLQKGMLIPAMDSKRKYVINFVNNPLLRATMEALDKEGFLPREK